MRKILADRDLPTCDARSLVWHLVVRNADPPHSTSLVDGHASIVTTERYDNQRPEALFEAARRLETGESLKNLSSSAVNESTQGPEGHLENDAKLLKRLVKEVDRRTLVERKIAAAHQARERVSLQSAKRVTVRLDGADRLVPPAECQLLDPAVWLALIVEAKSKGVSGAWSATLVFDERTGQLAGETTFNYEPTDAERRARRDQARDAVAQRKQRLAHDDPSGQLRRDAETALRYQPRP